MDSIRYHEENNLVTIKEKFVSKKEKEKSHDLKAKNKNDVQVKEIEKAIERLKISGLKDSERVFQNLYGDHSNDLEEAIKRGDWKDTKKILSMRPDDIIDEIRQSGLRGRGGAGFSSGLKADYLPKETQEKHYLVINADESEPGTCKDREILRHEPHKLLEGVLITSFSIHAKVCYIYVRGEFYKEYKILQKAIKQCYEKGFFGEKACGTNYKFDCYLHRGSGAYICGEESALLESIEGKPGKPRSKPPYPATKGLYGKPTAVFNVETVSVIPSILKKGAKWWSSFGRKNNTGIKLFCISGDVNNPCVVEEKMGVNMKDLIDVYAGGPIKGWKNVICVIPGGGSSCVLSPKEAMTVNCDFESLHKIGSSLGTGGIIVWSKERNFLKSLTRLVHFYKKESCGKCTPCREGTFHMEKVLKKFANGKGTKSDFQDLEKLAKGMHGSCFCPMGNSIADQVLNGFMKKFHSEFQKVMPK